MAKHEEFVIKAALHNNGKITFDEGQSAQ